MPPRTRRKSAVVAAEEEENEKARSGSLLIGVDDDDSMPPSTPPSVAERVSRKPPSTPAAWRANKNFQNSAEQYIHNCKKFDLRVDPNVVIALQTGWHILQPTKSFGEGSMLPLADIMERNEHVSKLNLSFNSMGDQRFRAAGNGNSNARILNSILRENKTIKELDLSSTGLDDDGIKEICDGIKANTSIELLSLANNHFGETGAQYLGQALSVNNSVKILDLSRNALNYNAMNAVMTCCGPKNIVVDIEGNFLFEEVLNAVTHGVAFLGALLGANIMISDAAETFVNNAHHFWACVVYSLALMFLFLSSTLFHSFFMLPTRKW